jgi:hypothetical protein
MADSSLYYTKTIQLDRSLHYGSKEYPLELRIVVYPDRVSGLPKLKARIYFPDGYTSDLQASVQANNQYNTDNDDDDNNTKTRGALLKLDMSIEPAMNQLYLGQFYLRPSLSRYLKETLPHERAAVKGLGRISLCHAIKTWTEIGPRVWPGTFPKNLKVHLMADGEHYSDHQCGGFLGAALRRSCNNAKLVRYYESIGFRKSGHAPAFVGKTRMCGNASSVMKRACGPQ